MLDKVSGVGEFEDDPTLRSQQRPQAGNKIIRFGYMGEDVIAQYQVRPNPRVGHFPGHFKTKEPDCSLDSLFTRNLGNVRRRLNPKARYTCPLEIPEQIAVIARDFHD